MKTCEFCGATYYNLKELAHHLMDCEAFFLLAQDCSITYKMGDALRVIARVPVAPKDTYKVSTDE